MRGVSLLVASLAVLAVVSGASSSLRLVESQWVLRDLGVSGTPIVVNDRGQIVVQAAVSQNAFLWEDGRVIGLGTLGGKGTTASSMNERGQVVGQSQTATSSRAFVWEKGRMRGLGRDSISAYGINERGQIIGNKTVNGAEHAFLWRNGTMTDLGTLGGKQSYAVAINESGQVVGWSATKRNDQLGRPVKHAFLWQAGKMSDLNPPGPFRSRAVAINEAGQVLIQTFRESNCLDYSTCPGNEDPTPTDERAWLWAGGNFAKLGTVGGLSATAVALNDNGQAIGHGRDHAVLWENGVTTDLGTLPRFANAPCWPRDINNQGQVVGSMFGGEPERWQTRGWVWENGRMIDLGTLGGGYAQVMDINERSQIVGQSRTKAAKYHIVLWTLRSG